MSCWAVPSIAAELWGVPLQQVLDGIAAGKIPSKSESGFTFVDMAPNSPTLKTPRALRPTPPTYKLLTDQELAALNPVEHQPEEYEQYLAEDDQTIDLADWRERRDDNQKLRRPPMAA